MDVAQNIIDSIDNAKDKSEYLNALQNVISVSESVEKEYQQMISIIENLEYAPMWVLRQDGSIFTQNKLSRGFNEIFKILDFTKDESEIAFNNKTYLSKIQHIQNNRVITLTDVTASKEKERLLSMGNMASHLAHEIRNPIGSISLSISSLMENANLQSRKIILDIKKAINRVERTIKATLMFSKEHQNINVSDVSLVDLFTEVEHSCEYYNYSKDIKFDFIVENKTIKADFELLLILFQNLVFNGIDAIEEDNKENGIIKIRYRENNDFHIFSVYDNGALIEDRSTLFQAFKTTKLDGNGIGLNLSRKIALAHNGDIKIDDNEKIFYVAIKN